VDGRSSQPRTPVVNKVTQQPFCTYASLVDPEEGTTLKYVPMADFNGKQCVKMERSDTRSEVEYWSTAIICGVVGANPPLM